MEIQYEIQWGEWKPTISLPAATKHSPENGVGERLSTVMTCINIYIHSLHTHVQSISYIHIYISVYVNTVYTTHTYSVI